MGEAKNHLLKALENLQVEGKADSVDAASAYFQLARATYNGNKDEKAAGIRNLHAALDIMRRRDPANPLQGDILDYLTRYAQLDDDYPQAVRWAADLLAFQTAQGAERNAFAIGNAHFVLGDLQSVMRRFGDAERNLRQAIDLLSRAAGPEQPEAADARARLGELLYYMGHRADAAMLLNEALKAQMLTPQGIIDATETPKTLGVLEFTRGRLPQAAGMLRQNLLEMKDQPDRELRYGISASQLAVVLAAQGQIGEAQSLYDAALDVYGRYIGVNSVAYARVLMRGGTLAIAAGKSDEAAAVFQRVLDGRQLTNADLLDEYARAVLGLAAANLDMGRTEAARKAADDLLQRILGSEQRNALVEQEAQTRRSPGSP